MILGAVASALLMCDRLRRCGALSGDGTADEADGLDLDERIARGDRMVAYDVIGQCLEDLAAFREQLGDSLATADTLARIAELSRRRGRREC